jgi:DNA replication protein DnaC
MNETLMNMIRKLRLSGLAETLEVRLHEATGNSLTHAEFLELIFQDEMLVRQQRLIARRVKAATFRDLKSLEDFDWRFNPSVKKNEIYDLATGRFVGEHHDVLICGPPGTGKRVQNQPMRPPGPRKMENSQNQPKRLPGLVPIKRMESQLTSKSVFTGWV